MDIAASLIAQIAGFAPIYIGLAVFALVIHEAGHVLFALALGIRVKRVGITWRGPFIVREQGSLAASALISLSAPVLNLVFAVAYWQAAPMFGQINMVLGLWNLLPFRGSDGSHAWNSLNRARIQPMCLDTRGANRAPLPNRKHPASFTCSAEVGVSHCK